MTEIENKDRCVALTDDGEGGRCSRVAKDGEFCFQLDDTYPVVDEREPTGNSDYDEIMEIIENQTQSMSEVKQDISQNISDMLDETGSFATSLGSVNFSETVNAFTSTVTKTAKTPSKYSLVGGTTGAVGGPLGVALGGTAGAWYRVYKVMNDDRAVGAVVAESVPDNAVVVPSDDSRIQDIEPIQISLQVALETGEVEQEWIKTTLTRERDMDSVESALNSIGEYEPEDGSTRYYIEKSGSGEILELYFGEDVTNYLPSIGLCQMSG